MPSHHLRQRGLRLSRRRSMVTLRLQHGVAVGARPSLPDLIGFGRRAMDVPPQEPKDYQRYQIGALAAFARAPGTRLQRVKSHGIEYHMVEADLPLGAQGRSRSSNWTRS